jgi:hypothetical protein
MFAGKARSKPLEWSTWVGFRVEGIGSNFITIVKKFIVQTHGFIVVKLLFFSVDVTKG